MLSSADFLGLESNLWSFDQRYDTELMERILAPDFFEFGRSGKHYMRRDLLLDAKGQRMFTAKLHKFSVTGLSATVALTTYISELYSNNSVEWANRSSIWDKSSGQWQLRFHQGTPIPAELVQESLGTSS